jgi:hypothetical protein
MEHQGKDKPGKRVGLRVVEIHDVPQSGSDWSLTGLWSTLGALPPVIGLASSVP